MLTIEVYAKASLHDIRGAVESLPDMTPSRPGPRGPCRNQYGCLYQQIFCNLLCTYRN